MALRISTALRNALANAVDDAVNAGGSPGRIEIRTGSQPATPDTAATGTVLATIILDATAFGGSSSGTITLNGVPKTVAASATGTAGWFRIYANGTATAVVDGAVGTSGAELNLNTTALNNGVNVTVTSGTIVMPGG
ncbi:hypothetical protein [Streptomyces microflavus]|uniref:hypothetical protein n=1 Tax=Streptomyces microflavus TaxID=1919 RepID=UPI0036AAB3F2